MDQQPSATGGADDAPGWRLSDDRLREAVEQRFVAMNQSYAAYLELLAELDSRPGSVPGARPGAQARTFAVHKLHRSPYQAGMDARAAQALAPDADPALGGLPRLGAALRAGEVSREHAEVAVKAMRRVPGHLLAETMAVDEVADTDLADELPGADEAEPDGEPGADEVGRSFCRGDLLDRLLSDQARRSDPGTIDRLAEYLQHAADPGGENSFDPEATQRRGLSIHRDVTGMEIIRGELDAANGAFFRAALDALSKPVPARTETAEDGTLIEVKDTRTLRERRADAAGLMGRLAMGALTTGRGAEPPRIVIHTTPGDLRTAMHRDNPTPASQLARPIEQPAQPTHPAEQPAEPTHPAEQPAQRPGEPTEETPARAGQAGQAAPAAPSTPSTGWSRSWQGAEFATGGFVPPRVLERMACDSLLQRALLSAKGAILDLGRDVRTVSPAQRRALVARDRGCVIPGCPAPAHHCEGHHVRWWRHDGTTDIDNLALLCGHHHTVVHQGIWTLTMRDGVPWAIPPAWVDPERRPLRNTYRDDLGHFHRTGTQLRLGLPGHEPPEARAG
jgi:Domain of unknown function (DUF222)